jgi:TPR repeat protein
MAGVGVEHNQAAARRWFETALAGGLCKMAEREEGGAASIAAQQRLGNMHALGGCGVDQSDTLAATFIRNAEGQGAVAQAKRLEAIAQGLGRWQSAIGT